LRQVYNVDRVIEVKDTRATAMDINENVLVVGNSKGYITAYEQMWDKKNFSVSVSCSFMCYLVLGYVPRVQARQGPY